MRGKKPKSHPSTGAKRRIVVDLSNDKKTKFKAKCAAEGKSMQEVIEDFIDNYTRS